MVRDYLSVYQAERFPEVPHFIGKHTVEIALKAFDTPFSILRPGYFFQSDAGWFVCLSRLGQIRAVDIPVASMSGPWHATTASFFVAEMLMGHGARKYEDFVQETAAAWTKQPSQ